MFKQWQAQIRRLRETEPGTRFINEYRRRKAWPEPVWRKAVVIVGALALGIIGLLLSIPPGMPGFLLWLPALAILVSRLRVAAVAVDWIDLRLARLQHRLQRKMQR